MTPQTANQPELSKDDELATLDAFVAGLPRQGYLFSILTGAMPAIETAMRNDFGFIALDRANEQCHEARKQLLAMKQEQDELARDILRLTRERDRTEDQLQLIRDTARKIANAQ